MPETDAARQVAPEVARLSRRLLPQAESLGMRLAELICAEIPEYAGGEYAGIDDVAGSCTHNVRYVLGILAGDGPGSLDSPRATGAARADQGFPYAAVLQAFRIGGRFIWELLVEEAAPEEHEVLLLAAADVWAVSDRLAESVTDAYRAALADRARRDGQRRAVLVGSLLDGDSAGAEHSWRAAGVLRLEAGADLVVVSAECPAPGTEGLRDVEQALRAKNVGSAWRLGHEHQDGVVALRFGFGLDALTSLLAASATGRVGVSAPFTGLEDAPLGRRQARMACAAATPGSIEVVRFEEHPLAVLLAGNTEQARTLAESVLGAVLAMPDGDREVLLETARAWLAAGGSTSTAARALHVHRNTVRYRIRRLEEVTSRDLTRPLDATEVHVALECVRILGLG